MMVRTSRYNAVGALHENDEPPSLAVVHRPIFALGVDGPTGVSSNRAETLHFEGLVRAALQRDIHGWPV